MSTVRDVAWKELVLQLRPAGRVPKHYALQGVPVVLLFLAVVFLGPVYLEAESLGFAVVMTGFILMTVATVGPMALAGDTFAGERERHTLETVLTAPVTPRQLFLGKMLAHGAVLAGGLVVATLLTVALVSLTPVEPMVRSLTFLVLPFFFIAMIILGFLVLLSAYLASLRSTSVKEANTRFGIYMMIGMGIGFFPTAVIVPLLAAFWGTGLASFTILMVLLFLQIAAVAVFLAFVGYMVVQLVRGTHTENFPVEL